MRLGGGLPARVRYGYQPRLSTSQTIVYGASRDRTGDLLLAKQALSQLSYGPSLGWWVWEELHPRPHPYQGCALTN